MGGTVGKVISFLGRPFGIYTRDETFTDLQVSNLLTVGEADKNARKNAKYASKGDSMTYFNGYRNFQKDYRRKYSKQFLENSGYSPNSTAQTIVLIESKVEEYIETYYGWLDVSIESSQDKFLTLSEKGNHAIRILPDYNYLTGKVLYDGKSYGLVEYADSGPEEVTVRLIRDYIETIEEYLTANYAYDGTNVTINGTQYLVGTFSSVLNINDEYEVICTATGLPDEIITVSADRYEPIVSNVLYDEEVTLITYRVISGEVGTELRYRILSSDTADLYNKVTVDITAIIPMKENNVMVDLESRKLERMLRKLNLSGEQLRSSITNPNMDSAYLMKGIDPNAYDLPAINKALFQTFDLFSPDSGNIVISISYLEMAYSFGMVKNDINGSIGSVGTYTKIMQGKGMTLRYQGSATVYRELVITDFIQKYTVSGAGFDSFLDSTGGYTRILIPLDVLNGLKYKEFVEVYERSLCMLAFSTETVEVRWYETTAFGTMLKIVGIVLLFISPSLGKVLIGLAIVLVAKELAKAIGGTAGVIIAVAAALVALALTGNFSGLETTDIWLQVANTTLSIVNEVQKHELENLMSNNEDQLNKLVEESKELQEKVKELEEDQGFGYIPFDAQYAGRYNLMYESIESYCNGILDTNVETLVDYSQQIDYALTTRNSVVSGIG